MTKTRAKFATRNPLDELMSDLRKEVSAILIDNERVLDDSATLVARLYDEPMTWLDVRKAGLLMYIHEAFPVDDKWEDVIADCVRDHLVKCVQSRGQRDRKRLVADRLSSVVKLIQESCELDTKDSKFLESALKYGRGVAVEQFGGPI
jgi:hypothetical protein